MSTSPNSSTRRIAYQNFGTSDLVVVDCPSWVAKHGQIGIVVDFQDKWGYPELIVRFGEPKTEYRIEPKHCVKYAELVQEVPKHED